jgi:hypothetical protein
MPRTKSTDGSSGDSSGPGNNKMEAVRRAMGALGMEASPNDIEKYLKEQFGMDMHPNMISSYKSSIRRKSGLTRRRRRGRPPRAAVASEEFATRGRPAGGDVPMKDLKALKEMAGRLGVGRLRDLVEVLTP